MEKIYHVIDLFAGAGGLSYGFEQAGFAVDLAIEKDAWAVETYLYNHNNKNIIEEDIKNIDDEFFVKYSGKIDVVMGGPPCQGFSIAASNRRRKDDARNTLYKQFLRVVKIVNPKIVLIENVKEIINYKLPDGTKIVKDIGDFLSDNDYVYDYNIVNCCMYGIPQDRKRFFCVAVKKNMVHEGVNLIDSLYPYLSPSVSFMEAVSDLPVVKPREYSEDTVLQYDKEPKNEYQSKYRGVCDKLYNHIPMRHTDKTVKKMEFIMSHTDEEIPDELKSRVRGDTDKISKSSYSQNHRVIDGNKVSPTITASFYSSFIHPTQPRNLTVREAARIQTFPDSFVFKGKKTTLSKKLLAKKGIYEELHLDQFNQVGNAVPPLMAEHLAKVISKLLKKGDI